MELIADMLLASGAIGAAFYCVVLSRRLSRFTDMQGGMGGAVAALSSQVDEMTKALERSRRTAGEQSGTLERSTRKAEDVARRLELLVASMHDIPAEAAPKRAAKRKAPPAEPKAADPEVAAEPEPAIPARDETPEAPAPVEPTPAPIPAPPTVTDADLAAAWDDWDPFEVAAPGRPGEDAPAPSAETTRAPGRAIGARTAPVVTLSRKEPGAPMPIFTAARPTEKPKRAGAAE